MDTELIRYIFDYCSEFYTDIERKALNHHLGRMRYGHLPEDLPAFMKQMRENYKTDDPEALKLLEEGYDQFVINTAERIYYEHRRELSLNLCPRCNRPARTPKAQQCRFCWFDWHNKPKYQR